jgi:hypothetical protein
LSATFVAHLPKVSLMELVFLSADTDVMALSNYQFQPSTFRI